MYDLHLELNRIGKNPRSISTSTRSSVFVVFVVLLDSVNSGVGCGSGSFR